MNWIVQNLWLIPALPLAAAAASSLATKERRGFAAGAAIGSMGLALILSCWAFVTTLSGPAVEGVRRFTVNFNWLQMGDTTLPLGWVLDPLSAVMLVMVTFVGLLIFIYSVGYMAHDDNFTRFFCFLALFAAAMLGLVIANSLLWLFMCWELVGLASYLLIGFWFDKPSAAAAAKKAFITTRVGDIGFFLGVVWLYAKGGTLLFYDAGQGCLEPGVLTRLAVGVAIPGLTLATGISLLLFCGAMGKSGQVPLHVWLPDAMEGPTPVSALIHAATMVAAGVFLVARVYPLMDADPLFIPHSSPALAAVTWVGAVTAIFAAIVAVAQTDIKRILAYSTVSQLGFMMMGLGVGGVAVGIFHLITHAFFKALLFLGAGSVIHSCQQEQDIRKMGGLRRFMPVTFATYAIGMMALSGVPIFFSGFWSKDEILHAAHGWPVSHLPFYLGIAAAVLTAFYMTRQVCYVFFGQARLARTTPAEDQEAVPAEKGKIETELAHRIDAVRTGHSHGSDWSCHESPPVMTWPLIILAAGAVLLGFLGTPAWPWFESYLTGEKLSLNVGEFFHWEFLSFFLLSSAIALSGIGLGWWLYGRTPIVDPERLDPLERLQPDLFELARRKFFVDELYQQTVISWTWAWGRICDWFDRWIWQGAVLAVSFAVVGLSWINRLFDEYVINLGFDQGCEGIGQGGRWLSRLQDGQVQHYLRWIAVGLAVLVIALSYGGGQ